MGDSNQQPEGTPPTESTSPPVGTGPLFAGGVEALAGDLLSPTVDPSAKTQPLSDRASDPASDQDTLRIGAAGVSPTAPAVRPVARRPRVPPRLGPYVLGEELGHGGMGMVFRARHEKLGTECAVKVLIAGEHASPELIARFQREAAAVAKMGKHPHIVGVFDLGEEAGLSYYAMELVEGRSLRAELKARTIPPNEAAVLVEKTARALHFAHSHGIIHRDMKPDNIVVRRDGEPQVMDFGLARDAASEEHLSITGQVMGTLAYMAPEQAAGRIDAMDGRTDVYALGGVLYELLTGVPPHAGTTIAATLPIILRGDIVPPRRLRADAPRDLETVAMKALALDPSRRYQTAEGMAEDLARWRRGEPIQARPVGWPGRAWMRARRHPLVSLLLAAVAASTLGLAWRFLGPAWIAVPVSPPDAQVLVNGRPLRRSGLVWPAGEVFLTVQADGYVSETRTVSVTPGTRPSLDPFRLRLDHGSLSVDSEPQGAEVILDDAPTGERTPVRGLREGIGPHVVRLRLPEHDDTVIPATIEPGEDKDLGELPLRHRTGTLSLTSSPLGADVVVREAATGRERARLTPPIDYPIETGPYVLEASKEGCFRTEVAATVMVNSAAQVHLSLSPQVLWSFQGKGQPPFGLAFADVDIDGVLDALVVSYDRTVRVLSGRDGVPLWTVLLDQGPSGFACVADLDLDGVPDAVVGLRGPGRVVALSGRDGALLWKGESAGESIGSLAIGDVDGDGTPDVISGTEGSGNVDAWSGVDGRHLWSLPICEKNSPFVNVADLDGDGRLECVISAEDRGVLGAFRASDRSLLWKAQFPSFLNNAASLADLDADGTLDCVVGCSDGSLSALSGRDGKGLWSCKTKGEVCQSYALADLDGDGTMDCVYGDSEHGLTAVSGRKGTALWKVELSGPSYSTPVFARIDGDDVADVLVLSQAGDLAALSGKDGGLLWRLETKAHLVDAPALGDIDGNGEIDCVVGTDEGGVLAVRIRPEPFGWSQETDVADGRPSTVDLNQDGAPDVIVGSRDGQVYAFSGTGGRLLWSHALRDLVPATAVAGDLDGDGIPDLTASSTDWHLYALSGKDGRELWTVQAADAVWTSPVFRDLNGDGAPEAIFQGGGALLAVSAKSGERIWLCPPGQQDRKGTNGCAPSAGDLDGDGTPDFAASFDDGALCAVSGTTGAMLWERRIVGPGFARVTVGDLDGDGRPDVVAAGQDAALRAFAGHDGSLRWELRTGGRLEMAPLLTEIDGNPGLEVVCRSTDGRLFALSGRRGELLWTRRAVTALSPTMLLYDFDADGVEDVVAAGLDRVELFSGRDGTSLWSCRSTVRDRAYTSLGDLDGDGRPEVMIALPEARHLQVLRVPPRFKPPRLATLRRAETWGALARRAEEEALAAEDAWTKATDLVQLGIARVHLGRATEALEAFAQARAAGLRSPDAAAYGCVASLLWKECPVKAREAGVQALSQALAHQPDALFDSVVGCADLLGSDDARRGMREALVRDAGDADAVAVAALLAAVVLGGDPSREALSAARAQFGLRLETATGPPARALGYLALAARALAEEDTGRRLYGTYLAQSSRPASLDLLLASAFAEK